MGDFWRRYDDQQTQTDFDAAGRAPGYEKALWGWWDVPDYARTLLNVPLVRAHHDDLPFLCCACSVVGSSDEATGSATALGALIF